MRGRWRLDFFAQNDHVIINLVTTSVHRGTGPPRWIERGAARKSLLEHLALALPQQFSQSALRCINASILRSHLLGGLYSVSFSSVGWKLATHAGWKGKQRKGQSFCAWERCFDTAAVTDMLVSLFDHALAALWRSIRVKIIVSFLP